MNKYKIVALIGKAGSGKDTILRRMIENNDGFNEIVSCTTRPPRDTEINGREYYFLTSEEFAALVLQDQMVEAAIFNDWAYGTPYSSLSKDKINIGIFNPTGIESLLHNKDIDLQVFYITCNDKTRLIRQLNREIEPDIDELFRRYKTDREDFFDLDFNYIKIINENREDLEDIERTIIDNIV